MPERDLPTRATCAVPLANLLLHAEFGGAALDHAPGVDPVHGGARERAGAARGRAAVRGEEPDEGER
jgi:hypothetical protein